MTTTKAHPDEPPVFAIVPGVADGLVSVWLDDDRRRLHHRCNGCLAEASVRYPPPDDGHVYFHHEHEDCPVLVVIQALDTRCSAKRLRRLFARAKQHVARVAATASN